MLLFLVLRSAAILAAPLNRYPSGSDVHCSQNEDFLKRKPSSVI
jgi:hypothetical protein